MERFLNKHREFKLGPWYEALSTIILEKREFLDQTKGNFQRFKEVVESLPDLVPSKIDLRGNHVIVGDEKDISPGKPEGKKDLHEKLAKLCPWRKGPFSLFGVDIDTEWQSWMKWDRLLPHLPELGGRRILDIGSSNGYYMFRMAAENPLFVLGLEPQSSFYYQYLAVQKFLRRENVFCLPITHDQLPRMDRYFDLVFCMGVLYHRKSPIEMLKGIHDSLKLPWKLNRLVFSRPSSILNLP